MPVVHTMSANVVFGAGKGIGQINAEREQYTRGVEQARLDMQKQQMEEARKIREIARIDADEKETRRQLEWDAIQKRQAEQFKTTQEGVQERWEGLSGAERLAEERRIRKEQEDFEFMKKIQAGQQTQPAVTQPTPQQEGIMGLITPKQDQFKGVPYRMPEPTQPTTKSAYTPPADIADYIDIGNEDTLERIHKKIKPLTPESKKKLRQDANVEAYGQGGTATQKQIKAVSIYNKSLKQRESDNNNAHIELINAENKIRVAKQKAEKGKYSDVDLKMKARTALKSKLKMLYGKDILVAKKVKREAKKLGITHEEYLEKMTMQIFNSLKQLQTQGR